MQCRQQVLQEVGQKERDWEMSSIFKESFSLESIFKPLKTLKIEVDPFTKMKHFTEPQNKKDKYRDGYLRNRKNGVIPTAIPPTALELYL